MAPLAGACLDRQLHARLASCQGASSSGRLPARRLGCCSLRPQIVDATRRCGTPQRAFATAASGASGLLDVKQLGKVAKALRRHQDKVMRLLAASTTATPQSIAAQLRDELARVQGRLAHLQQQADLLMVAEHQQQQQQLIQHAPLAVTPASASTTTTAAAAAPPRSLPASPLAARDLLSAAPAGHTTVLVCQGKACANKRAVEVLRAAGGAAADGAPEDVSILPCKCLGMCKAGPVMMVSGHAHEGSKVSTNYTHVGVADVPLVLEHVRGARQQQQPAPHGPVSPARRSVRASSLALHPQVDGATVA